MHARMHPCFMLLIRYKAYNTVQAIHKRCLPHRNIRLLTVVVVEAALVDNSSPLHRMFTATQMTRQIGVRRLKSPLVLHAAHAG